MNGAPFFIVGSGRSGSTLLRMILASHSRLAIPPETNFVRLLVERLPIDRPLSSEEVARALDIVTGHYRWQDMEFPAEDFRREATALKEPCLREVIEPVYRRFLAREGKRRWGDKTPAYILCVPKLAAMYPGSRFIHLVRDGRDVAKSFQSVGWLGPRLHQNTGEWNEALELAERWRPLLKERFLDVRYEDLVLRTDETVRRICDFLGEAFEPDMLAWEGMVDRYVPRREKYAHEKLKRRPDEGDVERWRREMTGRELFVAEAFMGKSLARAGYRRRYAGLLWAPLFPLARSFCRYGLPVAERLGKVLRLPRPLPGGGRQAAGGRSKT